MKKILLIVIVLCTTVILSGCQYFSRFVIVNNSGDSIVVKYETIKPGYRDLKAYVTTVEKFDANESDWKDVAQEDYKIDKEKGIVEVKLPPEKVLEIMSVNSTRIKENPFEELNLKSLEIKGENGLIKLEEKQIFKSFKPENRKWSIITPNYPTYILYYK